MVQGGPGDAVVLDGVAFTLNPGGRISLVGPNGCGKTLLLRIRAGRAAPDSRSVRTPGGVRIGYLPQGFVLPEGETVAAFLARAREGPARAAAEVERLAAKLSSAPNDEALQSAYDTALARLAAFPAPSGEAAALAALRLGSVPPGTPAAAGGNDILMLEDLSVGYGETRILREISMELRRGARAVLTGPNGSGKTTLLRTVAGLLPPLAGRVRLGAAVRPGFMAQEQETLDPALDALRTVQAEIAAGETDARRFLHYFLFSGDEVLTPIGSLSYGERVRLLLALLVARGANFLLLDEPINHLDIPSHDRFEQALAAFPGTVLAVVHDRHFIERTADEIWRTAAGSVRKVRQEPTIDYRRSIRTW